MHAFPGIYRVTLYGANLSDDFPFRLTEFVMTEGEINPTIANLGTSESFICPTNLTIVHIPFSRVFCDSFDLYLSYDFMDVDDLTSATVGLSG